MYALLITLGGLLVYAILVLVPGGAFSFMLHFLLSLPMQRRDRARPGTIDGPVVK